MTDELFGFDPDKPEGRRETGPDALNGAPTARVRPRRAGPWVVVERFRMDGAYDWFTWHLTRWGARRAVQAYEATGAVKGLKP